MKTKDYLKRFPNLKGKTFIVTGANSGLGFALSELLVSKGAFVLMANRNETKTTYAIVKIKKKYPEARVSFYAFDQSDVKKIDDFVTLLEKEKQTIDGIVFNAGVYFPDKYMKTKQGLPLTFGINFYGNYVLTKRLANSPIVGANTRYVFTTSPAAFKKMKQPLLQKIMTGHHLSRHRQYKGAKWALNIFAQALMTKSSLLPFTLDGKVYLYHPGVSNSNIARFKFKPLNPLAHLFMKMMFHPPHRAVLGALLALTTNEQFVNVMIVPRGPLEVGGLPRYKKIDGNFGDHLSLLMHELNNVKLRQ